MQPITLQKYRTRAQNFYRTHCGEDDPTSAQICAALLAQCEAYRPNSFSTLKSALVTDQLERGNTSAAAIRKLENPVTAPASQLLRKPKTRQVRKTTLEEFQTLYKHFHAGGHLDEAHARCAPSQWKATE